jgi:hypothetical protein
MTHACWIRRGRKETESMLFEEASVWAGLNEDGSVTIGLYKDGSPNQLMIRISAADAKAQAHVFRRWAGIR